MELMETFTGLPCFIRSKADRLTSGTLNAASPKPMRISAALGEGCHAQYSHGLRPDTPGRSKNLKQGCGQASARSNLLTGSLVVLLGLAVEQPVATDRGGSQAGRAPGEEEDSCALFGVRASETNRMT